MFRLFSPALDHRSNQKVAKHNLRATLPLQICLSIVSIGFTSALAGCGAALNSGTVQQGTPLTGVVHGGQQPISDAAVFLYVAGTTAPDSGASNLLKTSVHSDSNGLFNITDDYTCPSSDSQVYLVAQGGNPGLSVGAKNNASVLMTALGNCGDLSSSTYVTINEVTTAGAAWALAQFLSPGALVNSSPTNSLGLRNAFFAASALADPATGSAAGPGLTADAAMETTKLNTLADVLATCVNSDGTSACDPLFTAATTGSTSPTNTLDAVLAVVLHPGINLSIPVGNISAKSPFQPSLSSSPHDWTMSITYTGGGLDNPAGLALDSKGNLWAANVLGNAVTKISAAGLVTSVSDPSIEEALSVTVDSQDNVWITDQQSPSINNGYGSITKLNSQGQVVSGAGYTAGGIYFPYAIAADPNGSIWVADYGRATATLLDANGDSLSGVSGYKSESDLPFPDAVAIDGNHNAWFGAEGTATKVTPAGAMFVYKCCNAPTGIAIDPGNNVWLTDYSSSSLVELSSSGESLQTLSNTGGISFPEGLAIDGVGNVWVTNVHSASFSGVSAAIGGAASSSFSPSSGFGLDAGLEEPYGDAVDASGNLWISSNATNAIAEFVGVASPRAMPLLGPPKQP
jgi:streptogramin lyase